MQQQLSVTLLNLLSHFFANKVNCEMLINRNVQFVRNCLF